MNQFNQVALEGLLQTLTPQQLHDVLVHECAHVIRRDPLVGLLQRLAELLFWPHPLIHFMNRRLSQAREEVCDDYVLCAGDPIGYSRTLLAVAEACHARQSSSSLVTCLITPRWTLEARVAGLLDARRISMTKIHRGVLTVVAAVLLTTGLAVVGVRLGDPAGSPQEKGTAAAPQARPRRRPEQTRIIGLIVDEPGRPVAGTVVRVIGRETFTTTSGPDGTFTLVLDQPALHNDLLHASADLGARQGVVEFPDTLYQPETTVKVVLRAAKLVTVRVIDKQGAAVPNASIMVPVEYTSAPVPRPFPLLLAQTDAQGLAHLRVPADARVPNVVALKPGVGLDYYEVDRVVARLGKSELLPLPEKITLVLAGARTVKIRAIDSAGKPIRDVELYPRQLRVKGKINSPITGNSSIFSAKTDANGVATFDFLPERSEQVAFSVASQQFFAEAGRPTLRSSTELAPETTIRLLRRVPVSGRVIGADGQPAAGVLVQIDGGPLRDNSFITTSFITTRKNARTGVDGTFRFQAEPNMSYMIAVVDDQWAAVTVRGIVTHEGQPMDGIELRLVPGTVVRGRVTARPDHQPATNQLVTLVEQEPLVNAIRAPGQPRVDSAAPFLQRRTVTDTQGRYQFRVGPGEYSISMPSLIQPLERFQIGVEPEIVRDFDIDLPPVLPLTGVVVQKVRDDQPVASAIVEGYSYGTTSGRSNFHVTADGQGRFTTERYADPMMVVARSPDETLAGLAFIAADDRNARVSISTAATVHGRITYQDGKPIAEQSTSCRIVMDPPNQAEVKEPPPGMIRRLWRPPLVVRNALTDAEGRYTFAGIPVGTRWTLTTSVRIGDTRHSRAVEVKVANPGPISAPDLVFEPQALRNREPAKPAPGKAE